MKQKPNRKEDRMKTYELNAEFDNLAAMGEALTSLRESGEDVTEMQKDLTKQFNELDFEIEYKVENIVKLIRNMEAEVTAYETEINRMKKKSVSLVNQIGYIKEQLLKPLVVRKEGKIKAGLFTVSLRKSSSVSIIDAKLLPDKYKEIVMDTKIDKMAIKKDLKTGIISGAEMIENKSVQIR